MRTTFEYWHLLLLFKWVTKVRRDDRIVGEVELADLLNDMKSLSYKAFVSQNNVTGFFFIRSMCYQQFQSFEQEDG